MESLGKVIKNWAELGKVSSLPEWEDLPSIPLYMDQVLMFTLEALSFFQRDEESPLLTKSMVNNYVKCGLLIHPEKKKYTREQIAKLLMICILKQAISIQDIGTLFSQEKDIKKLYESFLSAHSEALHDVCVSNRMQGDAKELLSKALSLASEASANRTAAEKILLEISRLDEANQNTENTDVK